MGKLRAVDLFAGAGGFTLGAEMAGVRVLWAANHWPLAVKVHEANHPNVRHACQDLRQFDFGTLPPFDLLLASPACQGHSRAGRVGRARQEGVEQTHDELRGTAWSVVDCLEVCRPRLAIIENVPEFSDWPLMPAWLECLRLLGYEVSRQVLLASRWGVPQRRQRVVYIARLDGPAIELRDPNQSEPGLERVFDPAAKGWRPISKMRHTVAAPGYLTARQKAELANERLGGALGWGQHTNYGAWGLPVSEPCPTLTTVPAMLWWVRDGQYRLWTDGEQAAAMSFPRDYDLCGASRKAAAKLLGNAIPPLLAKGVIRAAARARAA